MKAKSLPGKRKEQLVNPTRRSVPLKAPTQMPIKKKGTPKQYTPSRRGYSRYA